LDAAVVSGWADRLAWLAPAALSEGECIELIAEAERTKSALAARRRG